MCVIFIYLLFYIFYLLYYFILPKLKEIYFEYLLPLENVKFYNSHLKKVLCLLLLLNNRILT